MLIVNADDLGRCHAATDRILACHARKRITSASVMVFMEDSERAAALAKAAGLDVGLHLNFTESFTAPNVPPRLRRDQESIRKFLRRSKYALLLYNPFLRRPFREVCRAQIDEFVRLFGRMPSRLDGHQHMHLAANLLLDRLVPAGTKVRRNFSVRPGDKAFLNRCYRNFVDRSLGGRHELTDYFFALSQHLQPLPLRRVVGLAKSTRVELMTHPEVDAEYTFLLGDDYARALLGVQLGTFDSACTVPLSQPSRID